MRQVRLGDVAEINPRVASSLKALPDQEIAFLPMDAIGEDGSVRYQERRSAASVLTGYTLFKRGDVLLAKITPCMENGKAAFLDGLATEYGAGSTEFHVLRPGPNLDGRFLFYLIWNPAFRFKAEARMTGSAGQKRVPADFLKDLEIPLPPLAEQRRIAAILDKADAIRRKRQQALALADDFLRSAFLEMFGSPVRNPHGWELCPIGECVTTVDAGWSAKGLDRPATSEEFGVLKVSAVTSGRYRPSENKAVEVVDPGRSLVIPRQGDFLFSRANTRELVAATCIVDRTVENVFLPDKLWRIRLDTSRITPEYLKFVLSDPVFRSALCAKATGTSGSMLNISQGKLLETPLPLPPVERQRSFSVLVQKTEAVRAQSAEARGQDETLFASLSQRAFRGDLLPDLVPA